MGLSEILDEGNPPTIERLHALTQRGYAAELGKTDTPDVIWMRHPVAGQPRVILYGNGMIAVLRDPASAQQIVPDDEDGFRTFVAGIPVPTCWQRGADTRIRILFYAGLVLAWVMLYAMGAWVWDVERSLL
ncbi:hypothetical protein VY88_32985 [Azospirillum thiophilum]|uniref:Uncharacterized protein n=2 Tax=Azospirillum thiophilum TaxID=528244 RepID=A0AAC8W5Z2_9PROT|nr:hypothetical protein AL072_32790 [Azospirillum thiophilum]KJR61216.1 hypothetical protein VY88_32985 [Azospirillum thiophilum]